MKRITIALTKSEGVVGHLENFCRALAHDELITGAVLYDFAFGCGTLANCPDHNHPCIHTSPSVVVEMVVKDKNVDRIIERAGLAMLTREHLVSGSGKVFVSPITRAVCVSTRGEDDPIL